ncbi:macro domain-containing protein [Mobiluncus curtisii]|uniref:Macro domain protein n=1 Tax=Mobiluncus curtisii ATCC 51333 TaxID=887326 RepID=E6LYF2_9ACTO|nr:macro domain-containing protein [Mobiluncus curtisii]EFU80195.1 macro domain protein [Mobiluncus curtisii ATCC 51333]
MQIHAIGGDLTEMNVDAIVNAANSALLGGGGVDGAIHRAAGPELLAACHKLRATRFPDGLPVGQAVATRGFNLAARWVIHTVGPNRHAGQTDPQLLHDAFANSLREAARVGARDVAFPAISGGVYGWDMAEVAHIGVSAVREYAAQTQPPHIASDAAASQDQTPDTALPIDNVYFVLFSPEALELFQAEIARTETDDDSWHPEDYELAPGDTKTHRNGMTLVDAYWIPDAEVASYRADRNAAAAAYTEAFRAEGYRVFREWAGSEDGEAITASDSAGNLRAMMHLDPQAVQEWQEFSAKYGANAHAELVKAIRAEHHYLKSAPSD